jgi:hypothetical protein
MTRKSEALPPPPVEILAALYDAWFRHFKSRFITAQMLAKTARDQRSSGALRLAVEALEAKSVKALGHILKRAVPVTVPGYELRRSWHTTKEVWRYAIDRRRERPLPKSQARRIRKANPAIRAIEEHVATVDQDAEVMARANTRECVPREIVGEQLKGLQSDPAPSEVWAGPFDSRDEAERTASVLARLAQSASARASASVLATDGASYAHTIGAREPERVVLGARALRVFSARIGRDGLLRTPEILRAEAAARAEEWRRIRGVVATGPAK